MKLERGKEGEKLGIEKGLNQGLMEGKLEKALETARLLKLLGDPVEKITRVTGLTESEIEKL